MVVQAFLQAFLQMVLLACQVEALLLVLALHLVGRVAAGEAPGFQVEGPEVASGCHRAPQYWTLAHLQTPLA